MKKLILITAILFISCSKDDIEEQPVETNDYVKITYTNECYGGVAGQFCATRSKYDNATIWPLDETGCYKIGLQDIDGNFRIEIFLRADLMGGCYL